VLIACVRLKRRFAPPDEFTREAIAGDPAVYQRALADPAATLKKLDAVRTEKSK
jgi:hypothetical protein